jgi:hypothetical protein
MLGVHCLLLQCTLWVCDRYSQYIDYNKFTTHRVSKEKKCHPQIRWLFVVLRISILSFSFFSFFKCTYQDSNLLLFFTSNIYKLYKTDTTKILYIISTLFFMSNNKRYTVIGPNVQWIFFFMILHCNIKTKHLQHRISIVNTLKNAKNDCRSTLG